MLLRSTVEIVVKVNEGRGQVLRKAFACVTGRAICLYIKFIMEEK